MNVKDLIKSGQLSEARSQLIDQVKTSPADTSARTLLFQVLVFGGEWDKAERHLEAISTQDRGNPALLYYKNLIEAEKERIKVNQLDALPSFLPKTPPYFQLYFQARQKLKENKFDKAEELLQQVEEQMSPISGTVNGKSFTGIRDTDSSLAYFLETFAHGKYVWIPFEFIRELTLSPPETLFDLVWASSTITTWEGLTLNCVLPVLYPNSSNHENDLVKMGKMTEWESVGGPFIKGIGQHVFEFGKEDVSLLEIKDVQFNFSGPDE